METGKALLNYLPQSIQEVFPGPVAFKNPPSLDLSPHYYIDAMLQEHLTMALMALILILILEV